MWTQIVEQTLLLVLIIGRWLLPVGKAMTRDQLSQLLLVYIGTAGRTDCLRWRASTRLDVPLADIIELFEAFKEQGVHKNLTIIHLILAAWSISLMQFTLVVTSTKTRKKSKGAGKNGEREEPEKGFSCRLFWETELWVRGTALLAGERSASVQALSTTILLQDGPFLCLRLGLIIHYKIISQSNVFFTTKNFLVVLLQLYRVCVIIIEHRKRYQLARASDGQLPVDQLPGGQRKAPSSGHRKRTETTSTMATEHALPLQTTSMTNLRSARVPPHRPDLEGNTDPLPRRKRTATTSLVPAVHVPTQSRSTISHSNSLIAVHQPNLNVTTHKICTEV